MIHKKLFLLALLSYSTILPTGSDFNAVNTLAEEGMKAGGTLLVAWATPERRVETAQVKHFEIQNIQVKQQMVASKITSLLEQVRDIKEDCGNRDRNMTTNKENKSVFETDDCGNRWKEWAEAFAKAKALEKTLDKELDKMLPQENSVDKIESKDSK